MPTHPRQTIREALVTLLTTAATTAGSNVFDTRVHASDAATQIRVYALEESFAVYNDLGQRNVDRTVGLAIECIVQSASAPEDALDTLCREVELAIESDFLLGNRLLLNQYESTSIEIGDPDSQKKVLKATLIYRATYRDTYA